MSKTDEELMRGEFLPFKGGIYNALQHISDVASKLGFFYASELFASFAESGLFLSLCLLFNCHLFRQLVNNFKPLFRFPISEYIYK